MARYSGKYDKWIEISTKKLYNKSAKPFKLRTLKTSIDVTIYKPKT